MALVLAAAALGIAFVALGLAVRAGRVAASAVRTATAAAVRTIPEGESPPARRPATDPVLVLRVEALESRLASISAGTLPPPAAPREAREDPRADADALASLRARLEREGFERVRVTVAPAPAGPPEVAGESLVNLVNVEAVRAGLVHRGRVPLPADADALARLRPATRLFP